MSPCTEDLSTSTIYFDFFSRVQTVSISKESGAAEMAQRVKTPASYKLLSDIYVQVHAHVCVNKCNNLKNYTRKNENQFKGEHLKNL